MEHKAFLFDYDFFAAELLDILVASLASGDCVQLVEFIDRNRDDLKDPYEGEPLEDNWEDMLQFHDPHQYGDFALTKYYDPTADIGLAHDWQEIQNALAAIGEMTESPILGTPVGPSDNLFDPGKMGSYFQSWEQVCLNHALFETVTVESDVVDGQFAAASEMLEAAKASKKGLYVTF